MDKESVERLRFDRRLKRRSGWLSAADEEEYLSSLPDVSDKMTTCAEEEESVEERSAATESNPVEASTPVATAGDFSAPSPFGSNVRSSSAEGSSSAGTGPGRGFGGDSGER